MSRSEDLVIIRAELADLTDAQRDELAAAVARLFPARAGLDLAVNIREYRMATATHPTLNPEHVRTGRCRCGMCEFGRALDELGLL
jgi:hypothetical protein